MQSGRSAEAIDRQVTDAESECVAPAPGKAGKYAPTKSAMSTVVNRSTSWARGEATGLYRSGFSGICISLLQRSGSLPAAAFRGSLKKREMVSK